MEQSSWEAKVAQLVKKLHVFYASKSCIAVFIKSHQRSQSTATLIRFKPSHTISLIVILILYPVYV
jgi:hypothetical protein